MSSQFWSVHENPDTEQSFLDLHDAMDFLINLILVIKGMRLKNHSKTLKFVILWEKQCATTWEIHPHFSDRVKRVYHKLKSLWWIKNFQRKYLGVLGLKIQHDCMPLVCANSFFQYTQSIPQSFFVVLLGERIAEVLKSFFSLEQSSHWYPLTEKPSLQAFLMVLEIF